MISQKIQIPVIYTYTWKLTLKWNPLMLKLMSKFYKKYLIACVYICTFCWFWCIIFCIGFLLFGIWSCFGPNLVKVVVFESLTEDQCSFQKMKLSYFSFCRSNKFCNDYWKSKILHLNICITLYIGIYS